DLGLSRLPVSKGLEEGRSTSGHPPAGQPPGERLEPRLLDEGGSRELVLAFATDLVPSPVDRRGGDLQPRPGDRVPVSSCRQGVKLIADALGQRRATSEEEAHVGAQLRRQGVKVDIEAVKGGEAAQRRRGVRTAPTEAGPRRDSLEEPETC